MEFPSWPSCLDRAHRENWLLKLLCSIVAAWFIYDELNIFFVDRPMSNSDEITHIGAEILPDISVCPVPPLDIPQLQSQGYLHYFGYYLGLDLQQTTFLGWGGLHQQEPVALLNTLSTMKEEHWTNYTLDAYFFTSGDYRKIQAQVEVPKVCLSLVHTPTPGREGGLPPRSLLQGGGARLGEERISCLVPT
jgi:hypothetical protein